MNVRYVVGQLERMFKFVLTASPDVKRISYYTAEMTWGQAARSNQAIVFSQTAEPIRAVEQKLLVGGVHRSTGYRRSQSHLGTVGGSVPLLKYSSVFKAYR